MSKIIAMYLPQYHEIEENNKWWGKGHTEWISCKKSKPLFKDHYQPRIPLNNNYYDLTEKKSQVWQAQLAKEYGIYGFCYYHYWFEGNLLLEKPAENMLKTPEIDIPFCFSWANHTWSNTLRRKNRNILISQSYGDRSDWINHFNYLLPFFNDKRYIKIKDKPMFIIYDAKDISCWDEMKSVWNKMAKENGFPGIHYVSTLKHESDVKFTREKEFDAQFEYQPRFSLGLGKKINFAKYYNYKRILHKDFLHKPCKISYDKVWKQIIKKTPDNGITTYLGCYTDWDTTARWSEQGEVHIGGNPKKFEKYLHQQIQRSKNMKESDFIFITAWNEWSEGAYLEPDEKYGYKYLEAIKNVINESNKGK